jgi:hypothetical protein
MGLGWSVAAANAALDKLITDYPYTKLHVGDPGAAGTANAAVNTVRTSLTWAAAALGAKTNSATEGWTSVSGAEDYTHFTQWSTVGPAGGNFGGSGLITANPVAVGDDAKFAPGALVLTAGNVAS